MFIIISSKPFVTNPILCILSGNTYTFLSCTSTWLLKVILVNSELKKIQIKVIISCGRINKVVHQPCDRHLFYIFSNSVMPDLWESAMGLSLYDERSFSKSVSTVWSDNSQLGEPWVCLSGGNTTHLRRRPCGWKFSAFLSLQSSVLVVMYPKSEVCVHLKTWSSVKENCKSESFLEETQCWSEKVICFGNERRGAERSFYHLSWAPEPPASIVTW